VACGAVQEVLLILWHAARTDRVGGAALRPMQRLMQYVLKACSAGEVDEPAERAFAIGRGGRDENARGRVATVVLPPRVDPL
jgi:hypothetical protein